MVETPPQQRAHHPPPPLLRNTPLMRSVTATEAEKTQRLRRPPKPTQILRPSDPPTPRKHQKPRGPECIENARFGIAFLSWSVRIILRNVSGVESTRGTMTGANRSTNGRTFFQRVFGWSHVFGNLNLSLQ